MEGWVDVCAWKSTAWGSLKGLSYIEVSMMMMVVVVLLLQAEIGKPISIDSWW